MRNLIALTLISLATLVATPAAANVRAPGANDGGFTLPQIAPEALANITLEHERLEIRVPEIVKKEPLEKARVVAEYTLSNSGEAFELPLVFLAMDIDNPKVVVNGKELAPPAVSEMSPAQVKELDEIREQKIGRPRFARSTSALETGSVSPFKIPLTKGKNVLRFEYDQRLWFDENDTGYHRPKYDVADFKLHYLLYPALTWSPAADFKLDVEITIADFRAEGWFWDTYWAPAVTPVEGLTMTSDQKAHVTTLRGTFDKFPSEVLAIEFRRGSKR